jgi:hypothetical protein
MLNYQNAPNIMIDADQYLEGALGLSWFPSAEARAQVRNYENDVLRNLNIIRSTWTGYTVIQEIGLSRPRTMRIKPWPNAADQNADASPTNWADGELRDVRVHDGMGNIIPGLVGTGRGSDVIVRFTGSMWGPGNGHPTGPSSEPDEILLHEMLHGFRFMTGRAMPLHSRNPRFDTDEEFAAILITNMYRSERRRASLRADHWGFQQLPAEVSTSESFLGAYRSEVGGLFIENRRLFGALGALDASPFNPCKVYMGL